MRWLASTGRAVALGELLAARAEGRPTAPGAVHVTFDDAYGDFRDLAWPILRRHGVPVTLFVPTAFPGHAAALLVGPPVRRRCAPRRRGCSTRRSARCR